MKQDSETMGSRSDVAMTDTAGPTVPETVRDHAVTSGADPGRRHQVVVIGSGFGGLFGAKALKRSDVDVLSLIHI